MLRMHTVVLASGPLFNKVVSQKFGRAKEIGIGKAQTLWAFGKADTAPRAERANQPPSVISIFAKLQTILVKPSAMKPSAMRL